VTAIVLTAVIRIGKKSLKKRSHVGAGCVRFHRDLFFQSALSAIVLSAASSDFSGACLEIKIRHRIERAFRIDVSVIGDDEESPRIRNQICRARFGSRFFG
jgi:hypothetical protein